MESKMERKKAVKNAVGGIVFETETNVHALKIAGEYVYGRVTITLPAEFIGRRVKVIVIAT